MDMTGTYLFGASCEATQADQEAQVSIILSTLKQVADADAPLTIGLTSHGVRLITWLMDLGAAPGRYQASNVIRMIGANRPMVNFLITPEVAEHMRALVEIGEARHRAGALNPDAIRIH